MKDYYENKEELFAALDYMTEPAAPRTPSSENGTYSVRVKKKRRSKKKKTVRIVVLTILAVLLLAGAAMGLYMWKIQKDLSFSNAEEEIRLKEALSAQEKDKPFYVLLLGLDAENEQNTSRSDVMILTRVDPENATLSLVSIPRDTMVDLPGYGRSKINAAFAYDGAAGAVDAVKRFAGVPISHYAEVDFDGLKSVVDQLGGVWVDVPVANNETGASNTRATIEAGEQHMNGEQALAFARERYGYEKGDFQRSENQRILVEAILREIMQRPPVEIPGLIESLAQSVSTDYTLADLFTLANKFRSADSLTIYSAMVPSSTLDLDGVSYAVTEYDEWSDMLAKFKAGIDPNADTVVASKEDTEAKE